MTLVRAVLLVNRALCYKRKEDWEKMESDCLKALLMDPDLHKVSFPYLKYLLSLLKLPRDLPENGMVGDAGTLLSWPGTCKEAAVG